jgi:DUF1365 family protein
MRKVRALTVSELASCLYEGTVLHRRHEPPARAFRYRVFMAYIDLAEIDELYERLAPIFLDNRSALVQLRRSDYHGDPDVPLREAIGRLLQGNAGCSPACVRLLTNLRTFGHCFNPVSFYYCFDRREQLRTLVVEVTNTPWGERHAYVLDPKGGRSPKLLHVSPFMGMDCEYECDATAPGDTAHLSVRTHHAGRLLFAAGLTLRRRELTRRGLARMLTRYPLQSAQIQARIYSQALRLRVRGAPYHPHPTAGGAA